MREERWHDGYTIPGKGDENQQPLRTDSQEFSPHSHNVRLPTYSHIQPERPIRNNSLLGPIYHLSATFRTPDGVADLLFGRASFRLLLAKRPAA